MFEFRPPPVVEADAALTLRLRLGDETAVRELVDRYGGLVHAVALDAAQESPSIDPEQLVVHTFLQAWRNSEAFEPGRSFAPWLATLGRSVAIAAGCPVSGDLVDALLAERDAWVELPDGLDDRIVAAVVAEAHVDPSEVYTAADLAAARAAGSSRAALVRAAVLGLVGGLVLLLVVVLGLSALGGSESNETTTIELRPTGRILDVEGSIEVEQVASGVAISLETSPLPDLVGGGMYQAWVALDDGTMVAAGSFLGGAGEVNVELSAAVPEAQADQFVLVGLSAGSRPEPGMFGESDVIFRAPLP